ncbi:hypothetical protein LCGC14_2072200 [marine sediment metagenome]|uniref:Uncharacterized protein n=1 Tax=marine sediment metagenome TaxID=412755 RepID=A0A0F9GWF1_9ZZZZ
MSRPVVHYLVVWRGFFDVPCNCFHFVPVEMGVSQNPDEVTCRRCRRTKVFREAQK